MHDKDDGPLRTERRQQGLCSTACLRSKII